MKEHQLRNHGGVVLEKKMTKGWLRKNFNIIQDKMNTPKRIVKKKKTIKILNDLQCVWHMGKKNMYQASSVHRDTDHYT